MTTSLVPDGNAPLIDLTAPAVAACAGCDFDGSRVGPVALAGALREVASRWRDLLDAPTAPPAAPGTDGWSALEHAGYVRDVLHALDIRVQRIVREDEPVLPETHTTPPAGANDQGSAVIVAALAYSAEQFARTCESVAQPDWDRAGLRRGRLVTALDLAREALHLDAHHRAAAAALLGVA